MSRTLPIALLAALFLLTGGVLFWYFSYGLDGEPPRRIGIPGLGAGATVTWHEDGIAAITAESETDGYAALGYVHGQARSWEVMLWRQTALGRLGEWFGGEVLGIDRFARRLGLAAYARQAYAALPEAEQALLAAYARGMNAALGTRSVRLREEFTLLDVEPDPWQPWHALALERLFAWLSAPPPASDTTAAAGGEARAFFEADSLLRSWLHVYGTEYGVAWAVQDSSGTFFFQRHTYGASALPLFQEVVLSWPVTEGVLLGTSLPGTPFFPAGRTAARAWALLPTGTVRLVQTVQDTTAGTVSYERILTRDGAEHLLQVRRTPTAIPFDPPPRPPTPDPLRTRPAAGPDTARTPVPAPADTLRSLPDSTWAVQWPGLQPTTDWRAWRSLLTAEAVDFRLLEANGLAVGAGGSWEVLGTPEVVARFTRGILVGNADWSRYLALRLDSLSREEGPVRIRNWTTDLYSPWAAELAPALVASVDSIPDQAAPVEEALNYLRNWNYVYDRTSIAAGIFDTWVAAYREMTGRLPEPAVPDTVYFENLRRYQALAQAVDSLRRRFGDDLLAWRWENASPDQRFFPVWSADTLLPGTGSIGGTRYAPIDLPTRGHPSTLLWGPSPALDQRPAPAAWEGWISTDAWDRFFVRRRYFDLGAFLGRYRVSNRIPAPIALTPEMAPLHETTLIPVAVEGEGE